jgi:hypothetical protein
LVQKFQWLVQVLAQLVQEPVPPREQRSVQVYWRGKVHLLLAG